MQKKNRGLSLWETSTTTPLIQIKGVSKKFGDFTAVDHVSLDIFEGELFCLLGGSGCGKTTLLRMLAGFEEPTTGSIERYRNTIYRSSNESKRGLAIYHTFLNLLMLQTNSFLPKQVDR